MEEPAKPKGTVTIIHEWCKGCGFCVEFCPTKALEQSREFNTKGYHPPLLRYEEKCSGCNLCGMICPDFCIWGSKL
jgi:2-oxoglutarate ferredoxin oxidoreductase subunit delta